MLHGEKEREGRKGSINESEEYLLLLLSYKHHQGLVSCGFNLRRENDTLGGHSASELV